MKASEILENAKIVVRESRGGTKWMGGKDAPGRDEDKIILDNRITIGVPTGMTAEQVLSGLQANDELNVIYNNNGAYYWLEQLKSEKHEERLLRFALSTKQTLLRNGGVWRFEKKKTSKETILETGIEELRKLHARYMEAGEKLSTKIKKEISKENIINDLENRYCYGVIENLNVLRDYTISANWGIDSNATFEIRNFGKINKLKIEIKKINTDIERTRKLFLETNRNTEIEGISYWSSLGKPINCDAIWIMKILLRII